MILAPFYKQKYFWKYQTILSKKSNMSQQPYALCLFMYM